MNVYDFDGTIYNGDITIDFFLYAIKQNPSLVRYLPKQLFGFALYATKRINKTKLKEFFFCFLPAINVTVMTESFWNQNQHKIFDWYLKQQKPEDIIISASPEFLLKPICEKLGISFLIASEVSPETGMFSGENCYGEEKVRRLAEKYKITHLASFYSDSPSDLPLARIADNAFLIRNGVACPWREKESS